MYCNYVAFILCPIKGIKPEFYLDECTPNPCQNGGTSKTTAYIDMVAWAECSCPAEFRESKCQTSKIFIIGIFIIMINVSICIKCSGLLLVYQPQSAEYGIYSLPFVSHGLFTYVSLMISSAIQRVFPHIYDKYAKRISN